jgi:phosphatidylglycerophosphate synthase
MALSSFERRLLSVLCVFFVVQIAGFAVFQGFYHLPTPWDWVFYPATAVYHALLWLGLLSIRKRFNDLDDRPLTRVGIPNLLTLFRLTSLPIIALVFLLARQHPSLSMPLVVFVSVAFLTDLLDGFLARTFKMGTQLGKTLDSSTDYVILASLSIVLGITGVLQLYLLAAILVRLGFQVGAVIWVQVAFGKQFVETTWLGKASLFILMVLYAVEILVFLRLPGMENSPWVVGFEIFTAFVMVISTVDKIVFFARKLRED